MSSIWLGLWPRSRRHSSANAELRSSSRIQLSGEGRSRLGSRDKRHENITMYFLTVSPVLRVGYIFGSPRGGRTADVRSFAELQIASTRRLPLQASPGHLSRPPTRPWRCDRQGVLRRGARPVADSRSGRCPLSSHGKVPRTRFVCLQLSTAVDRSDQRLRHVWW